MKIYSKRKTIEMLLCAASSEWFCLSQADEWIGHATGAVFREAIHARAEIPSGEYHTLNLEAAYRLIESSPTLRREWFGR